MRQTNRASRPVNYAGRPDGLIVLSDVVVFRPTDRVGVGGFPDLAPDRVTAREGPATAVGRSRAG